MEGALLDERPVGEVGDDWSPETLDGRVVHPERAMGELNEQLAQACGELNAATARLVRLLEIADRHDLWGQAGIRSPSHFVTWQTGLSAGHAHQLLTLARELRERPAACESFHDGRLTADQAAAVVRNSPATHDQSVTQLAESLTVGQIVRTLRRQHFGKPTPTPDPEKAAERTKVAMGDTPHGTWSLNAELPADVGARVKAALEQKREELWRSCTTAAERLKVTWAQAFMGLIDDWLAADHHEHPHRNRARVHVHLEVGDGHLSPEARLHLGQRLPDAIRQLLTCDCSMQPIWESHGVPMAAGPSVQTIPERVRKVVEDRDGGCFVPWCNHTHGIDIHHIIHREHGGPTEPWNLAATCQGCHRDIHLGKFSVEGNADLPGGLVFRDRHGRVTPTLNRPQPPNPHRRRIPSGPYRHPLGERLDLDWVCFAPDPPPPDASHQPAGDSAPDPPAGDSASDPPAGDGASEPSPADVLGDDQSGGDGPEGSRPNDRPGGRADQFAAGGSG